MSKDRCRLSGLFVVTPVLLMLLVTGGCNRDPNVRKQKYLESGKHYEAAGKLKEASIQFSNALKVDREFPEAHYELAKVLIKLGSVKQGYGELVHAVDLAPKNEQAHLDLGSLLLAGNAADRALEQAKLVIDLNPNNADAYALIAAASARKGNRADALTNIQHALALKPNEASFHTTLALIQSTDPASGGVPEQELQKAITLDGKDTHARMVLAALLEKRGDRQGAEQQYLAAMQVAPKDFQPRAGLAGLEMRSGNQAKAEETLRKAVEDLSDNPDAPALLKDYYLRTNQADKAESTFADLNSKYPKSFSIKLNYAGILAARGKFDKVAPLADQLGKMNGTNPQVQLLRSALLLNDHKVDEAYNMLQSALKTAPDNPQIVLAAARVALMKGDIGAAESNFRTAERLTPVDPSIQASLAQLASQRGDVSGLGQAGEKTIAIRPDLAQGYLWRGMAEMAQKLPVKAEADFQTALQKDPNNASVYTELGRLRLAQSKVPEGITMLEKALDKDPNSTMALGDIVGAYMYLKQPEKAEARIQQQIAKAPKNAELYTLLGEVQLSTRDFNGAHDSANKALGIDPTSQRAVQVSAQAAAAQGHVDEAIQIWDRWSSAHPKDPGPVSMMAMLEDQKGDTPKAMEYYKKTLDLANGAGTGAKNAQALAANNLAYLMVENNQSVDMALTYAQMARSAMPHSPDTADTLAWVYYHKGTFSTARGLLEDALKQNPENASMHYHLGMTYNMLGRKSDAEAQLKKAVSLDPNGKPGKDAAVALAKLG